ncbi:hypothetical protein TrispH2_008738 [Trichoplax sp. H2]|nr:hypothetical protein TrispH2_008738 [Trichoplax sp. H2]|eukprot:RDD40096.1 hypothetical protein TrispH2_008738 [Trichoplax sp. H2]
MGVKGELARSSEYGQKDRWSSWESWPDQASMDRKTGGRQGRVGLVKRVWTERRMVVKGEWVSRPRQASMDRKTDGRQGRVGPVKRVWTERRMVVMGELARSSEHGQKDGWSSRESWPDQASMDRKADGRQGRVGLVKRVWTERWMVVKGEWARSSEHGQKDRWSSRESWPGQASMDRKTDGPQGRVGPVKRAWTERRMVVKGEWVKSSQ